MTALRLNVWTKVGLLVLLVGMGDLVVHGRWSGAVSSLLAVAAAVGVTAAHPAVVRSRLGLSALLLAGALALLPIERPSLLGWLLLWTALAVAALAPRANHADHALRWTVRVAVAAVRATSAPLRDLRLVRKARRRAGGGEAVTLLRVVGLLGLPLVGGTVFALLFANANPVIGHYVNRLRLPEPDMPRLVLWVVLTLGFWLLLRPRGLPKTLRVLRPRLAGKEVKGVPGASVLLSLVVFNGLFALQNGLDLAYLWGGADLPEGTSFAEYAHRGAYPLILTALLAGAFVLVFLAPGSSVAKLKAARLLVAAWVAQNVFLVVSTALRTLAYIDAYSLTRLRIAALAWMALVALGLALIAWRLLRGKSSSWLINANAAAAGLVLGICATVDLGAVAAAWNVRHARELGTGGAELDLCYLRSLGPAALVPLSELQQGPLPPSLRPRVANVRNMVMLNLIDRQRDARSWTWRGARRSARAQALAGPPTVIARSRCDGTPKPPPLTPAPQLGS
ncbi:DUF4173 domain-containing protein [Phenylobacterium sp. LjRoot225]|uniref:DUF4153 domain-containing protein n=1 Tax=Phenylobacterium sp. LjRoot225 TaxID=3342285 RepID=UPI003ECD3602